MRVCKHTGTNKNHPGFYVLGCDYIYRVGTSFYYIVTGFLENHLTFHFIYKEYCRPIKRNLSYDKGEELIWDFSVSSKAYNVNRLNVPSDL